jgi:glycosyltransferase involved in cell wall biosynthesis
MREVAGERPAIARLFAGDDPATLAAALEAALALTPGAAAACRTRAEDFPAQRTADAYLDLYRELGASG